MLNVNTVQFLTSNRKGEGDDGKCAIAVPQHLNPGYATDRSTDKFTSNQQNVEVQSGTHWQKYVIIQSVSVELVDGKLSCSRC